MKATEWPTNDQSIKTLAKYLGFAWRDTNPSGAASIEWFDRWVRDRDPDIQIRAIKATSLRIAFLEGPSPRS
jgi:predicted RecB family nuclease